MTKASTIKARLLLAVLLACLLCMLLAVSVQYPAVTLWETHVLWQIYPIHTAPFDTLNQALAYLGGMPAMLIITLLISVVAFFKQRADYSGFAWAAFVGVALLGWLGKIIFSRSRPSVWEQIAPFYGDSFPSNHSLYAITLACILVIMAFNTPWRTTALGLGIGWSLLMGLSRLYLGAHFPTDVLAGWSLGIAWSSLLCWLFMHFNLFKVNPFQLDCCSSKPFSSNDLSSNHFQHRASKFAGNYEV